MDRSAPSEGLLSPTFSRLLAASALRVMAASHMSRKEIAKMDDMNKRGKTLQEILAKLQAARNSKGETGPSKDGVD